MIIIINEDQKQNMLKHYVSLVITLKQTFLMHLSSAAALSVQLYPLIDDAVLMNINRH